MNDFYFPHRCEKASKTDDEFKHTARSMKFQEREHEMNVFLS